MRISEEESFPLALEGGGVFIILVVKWQNSMIYFAKDSFNTIRKSIWPWFSN